MDIVEAVRIYRASQNPQGNLLKNFAADDGLITAGRLALTVTVLFKLPLIVLPLRMTLHTVPRVYLSNGAFCIHRIHTDATAVLFKLPLTVALARGVRRCPSN